ncbi:hypothetical protein BDW62DRAFT_204491 [Aspergillus aurantiobrunneus]
MSASTDVEKGPQTPQRRGNGLYTRYASDDLELASNYKTGLYHPVHLGEHLGSQQQYRVIHKIRLGNGCAFAWLCLVRDSNPTRYVTVGILAAYHTRRRYRSSERCSHGSRELRNWIRLLQTTGAFRSTSFRLSRARMARTSATSMRPLAPLFRELEKKVDGDPSQFLRDAARRSAQALAALHRHGICHGDLRPHNILLGSAGIDGMSEPEAIEYLGEPIRVPVKVQEGYPPAAPHGPEYLVASLEYNDQNTRLASQGIRLTNFKQSFLMYKPPQTNRCALSHSPPEVLLGGQPSAAGDI